LLGQPDFRLHDSALDCRRTVPHARTCRTAPSLNSCFRASPDSVLAELPWSIADSFPDSPGWVRFDRHPQNSLWLTPRAGLRFSCRERQSAFAFCPNSLPFRAAVRVFPFGNTGSLQSLFPERLQPVTGLRRWLRQPGCDSERFSAALARNKGVFRSQC
jgi:hypothetical protein